MRSFIVMFIAIFSFASSSNLEITSDFFEADNANKQFIFKGNVKIKKGKDKLETNKLIVLLDKSNQAKEYRSSGGSRIEVFLKDIHYVGRAKSIFYFPKKEYYRLVGDAFLKDLSSDKEVTGEKIEIDLKNEKTRVLSGYKKPVKLIFKIDAK
jgi:lipopolysaccharide export system protein LptA